MIDSDKNNQLIGLYAYNTFKRLFKICSVLLWIKSLSIFISLFFYRGIVSIFGLPSAWYLMDKSIWFKMLLLILMLLSFGLIVQTLARNIRIGSIVLYITLISFDSAVEIYIIITNKKEGFLLGTLYTLIGPLFFNISLIILLCLLLYKAKEIALLSNYSLGTTLNTNDLLCEKKGVFKRAFYIIILIKLCSCLSTLFLNHSETNPFSSATISYLIKRYVFLDKPLNAVQWFFLVFYCIVIVYLIVLAFFKRIKLRHKIYIITVSATDIIFWFLLQPYFDSFFSKPWMCLINSFDFSPFFYLIYNMIVIVICSTSFVIKENHKSSI